MAPLLHVDNLTIRFPRAEPVSNLSFEIAEGETLAIVGESGSGKSLTALALMQLLPRAAKVASGRIGFDGRDLLQLDARAMRRLRGSEIAMIFQEPMTSLNPVMTIGRQIAETLILHQGLDQRGEVPPIVPGSDEVRATRLRDRGRKQSERQERCNGSRRR